MARRLGIMIAVVGLAGCESGIKVTRAEYGDAWPFTVESGYLDCRDGYAALFRANGVEYQLNGFAASRGYAAIDPIWRDRNDNEPGGLQLKVNLGQLVDRALKECRQ